MAKPVVLVLSPIAKPVVLFYSPIAKPVVLVLSPIAKPLLSLFERPLLNHCCPRVYVCVCVCVCIYIYIRGWVVGGGRGNSGGSLKIVPPSPALIFDGRRTPTNFSSFSFRLSFMRFLLRPTNGFFPPGTPVFPIHLLPRMFGTGSFCTSFSKVGLLFYPFIFHTHPHTHTHTHEHICTL